MAADLPRGDRATHRRSRPLRERSQDIAARALGRYDVARLDSVAEGRRRQKRARAVPSFAPGPDGPRKWTRAQAFATAYRSRARRGAAAGAKRIANADPSSQHDDPPAGGVPADRSQERAHVCLRADGLRPRPYRQRPDGGGLRYALSPA